MVVILEVVPDTGEVPIPLERTVSARGQIVIDGAETAPVPAGMGHSSTIRSVDGAGVVVERELSGIAPSPRRGWSSMLGSPSASEGWLLPFGPGAGAVADRLSVHNPGPAPVRFSVAALVGGQTVAMPGLSEVELGPAQRRELAMAEVVDSSPVPMVVTADGLVVVERDLSPSVDAGISTTLGIPLP